MTGDDVAKSAMTDEDRDSESAAELGQAREEEETCVQAAVE